MDAWTDRDFAERWDRDNLKGNPVRPEQLDIVVGIVRQLYKPGERILDLGFGSGQVEARLFAELPDLRAVCVDSSPAMMEIARRRLEPYQDRYAAIRHDLNEIGSLQLPDAEYPIILSIQSIHELPHDAKRRAFSFIFDRLRPGGTYLIMDRIAIDSDRLGELYGSVWDRLERHAPVRMGATFEEYVAVCRAKGDHPATIEENLAWLRDAGFHAACLHLHFNRALIGSMKPVHGGRDGAA